MRKRTDPIEDRLYKRTDKEGRELSPYWHVWGYDARGKRYNVSTGKEDPVEAASEARIIDADKNVSAAHQAVDRAQKLTLADALDLVVAYDKRVGAAPNTIAFHDDRARHLVRLLKGVHHDDVPPDGTLLLTDITLPALNRYTDARLAEGASRHTIQKEHRTLRLALRLAKEDGGYDGDPKKLAVEGFKKPNGARGFYPPGEVWLDKIEYIDALIAETSKSPDMHRIDRRDDVLLYINLGLRRREPLLIRREHVDLKKASVSIKPPPRANGLAVARETGLKTEESKRVLPLNPVMLDLFTRRLRKTPYGEPLFVDWGSGNRDLNANWTRARKALIAQAVTRDDEHGTDEAAELNATLPTRLTFNDLRRTFCSLMKNAGVSFEDCAELLGHGDIAMVRLVYGKTNLENLARAVAKLPAPAPLPQRLEPKVRTSRRQRLREKKRLEAEALAAKKSAPYLKPLAAKEHTGEN